MGYAKQWTPPTIPLRDDLAAWKTLFTDVHDCLIDAGLVQTATAGQLDISAVSALPADGTFEGFREYRFDDVLQSTAPVTIKLEFGCGIEGIYNSSTNRTRTPRIRATVSFKGAVVATYQCPQAYNTGSSTTSQLTTAGISNICYSESDGFLGLCYGAGSRNKPNSSGYGTYYGATLVLFIQRTLDSSGVPTGEGLGVYYPTLTTYGQDWGGKLQRSVAAFSAGGTPVAKDTICPRIGRSDIAAGVDGLLLEPLHYPSSPPQPFPFMVSYYHTTINEGQQFEFQPVVGPARNFIALGRETCLAVDSEEAHYAGVAMLFE
mgnify:CR=1 FL=1